jgi:hypothetical protein
MMGPAGAAFAAGFGALAALLLIGGGVLLRFQRNRLQFSLMQTALEKGTEPIAGAIPVWVLSLRQGVMIFVLGAGLILIGGGLQKMAENVPMPTDAQMAQTPIRMQGPPGRFGHPEGPPPRPPGRGEDGNRPGAGPGGPPPELESPIVQQWHRAQDQKALGNLALASGFILVLLGVVRVIFSVVERKYSSLQQTI